MNAPERLNVLLSRARCGLIMIGNEETFMASKTGGETWTKFLKSLQAKGCLHDGLPIRCEKHPDKAYLLKCPDDFDHFCPDGGCPEPWYVLAIAPNASLSLPLIRNKWTTAEMQSSQMHPSMPSY